MKFLSIIYGFVVYIRNRLYDYGILKEKKIENLEIVCIGNIVVGGTGKTPAVQYYVNKYLLEEKKVGILSRGYKGVRDHDPFIVRDYNKIYCTSVEAGDEAYFHALNLNVPIVVSKDRYSGAKLLKEQFNVQVVVMDDGFQHRKLKKTKNILLIDATNPFGGNEYLPKGKLRESLSEIKRADEIILTKSNYIKTNELQLIIEKIAIYKKKIYLSKYIEKNFYDQRGINYSLDKIKNKRVLIFSSIANPRVFKETIERLDPLSMTEMLFPDHHIYSRDETRGFLNESSKYDYLVTTEKDIVKINEIIPNLIVLKMEFVVENEETRRIKVD